MAKKYLRSDMSEQEARFYTCGHGLFGEENALIGLYKLIGKFSELKDTDRTKELLDYKPNSDIKFKYENRGITEINSILKAKYGDREFSRRDLKNLSRKRHLSRVLISFNCDCIITEIDTYIKCNATLKSACDAYLSGIGYNWDDIMPIQFDFLSTRFADQHKDYRKAGKIINDISTISFK